MNRTPFFASPLLLGFEALERHLDRAAKSAGDGYPPYNIERQPRPDGTEALTISLAVAGFRREELEIIQEENQLVIKGRQTEEDGRAYLHRGIAARQFQRTFILADGMDVTGATLENGLLAVNLERPEPAKLVRRIEIKG
jgi:HSP20 family molecular chaperone IbpA